MLPVKLTGLGFCLPALRVPNAELEARLALPADWIASLTGVRERRRAVGETAVAMAAAAGAMALEQAGLPAAAVDLVIAAASAPHQAIPCTAALVQRELGLPDGRVFAFDVNATCLSFLVALEVAARMVAAGAARHALIVSSEITRDSLNPEEPESYVLMGDAAAAAILSAAGPGEASALCHSAFTTYASGADLTRVAGGGTLHHPNDPATTAAMNYFTMEGPAVYRMAARLLPPFLERFLAEAGWERTTIDAVVPHQASSRGLELLTRRCSFRPEQLVINLAERGNCVAASIPLALAEAVHAGRIRRGHRLLLVGTGAGLSLGAATLVF